MVNIKAIYDLITALTATISWHLNVEESGLNTNCDWLEEDTGNIEVWELIHAMGTPLTYHTHREGSTLDKNLEKQLELVRKYTIYEVVHGSHAYGTNLPTSDTDKKGICLIPDIHLFLGSKTFEQQDGGWTDAAGQKEDKVVYHLPKFIQLAAACNPNIIEVLFADESDILVCTEEGKRLRDNRHLFVSRKARHTFTGYAQAQLHRMKAHHRWTSQPPQKPESAAAKHIKKVPVGPLGTHLAQSGFLKKVNPTSEPDWFELDVEVFDKGSYEAAKKEWENYETWKANRNEKRAELERKYGIDVKHAMHLVRLLRMGYEIVTTGQVIVKRPDREELLSIRHGAWSYEQIIEYADEMEKKIIEAEKTSTLPWGADMEKIEALQIDLIRDALRKAGQI